MKQRIILFLLTAFTTAISFSQSNFIDQPYIEVTGTSELEITPNEIYIKITLNENDKRGKISIEEQEAILIKKLKTLGIDIDNCLFVLDFDGFYQKKPLSSNEVVKIKSYELLISNPKNLAPVFKALDSIDISNASINRISHSEIKKFQKENKIKTIKIAKEKAKYYCEAIEQLLGNAIHIKEINNLQNISSNQVHE